MPDPTSGATPAIPNRRLYSPVETQELLGVSHATVYRLIKAGQLVKVKILGGSGITADSIDRLCVGEVE